MKRLFDLLFSTCLLLILSPVLLLLSLIVILDSGWPVFYAQERIGKDEKPFRLLKFRTMKPGADKMGLLTIGGNDSRITRSGRWLRKYKLDELPQFINVLLGDMSVVGPRPEVERYVRLYSETQKQVFRVKPGITDYASLKYVDENEILKKSEDPETMYRERIMPEKLKLNLRYIEEAGLGTDIRIIWLTVRKILGKRGR